MNNTFSVYRFFRTGCAALLLGVFCQPASAAVPETFFGGYRTISQLYSDLQATASSYPQITQLHDYGDSYAKTVGGVVTQGGETVPGHDLLAIKVTNKSIPGPKPVFFLMAGIHAREIATPEVVMRFLDWLTENYGIDADATWLVDHHEIWIAPATNPDGHWLVELGTTRPYSSTPWMWRKNAHSNNCTTWPPTASSQSGVDLNRNFVFQWGAAGSSTGHCSQFYRGIVPGSEPEVLAIQDLVGSLIPDQRGPKITDAAPDDTTGIFIQLHSPFRVVGWPWAHTSAPPPNEVGLKAIGRKLASYNGYPYEQAHTGVAVMSGTADGWAYGTLGVPSFIIELGDGFMPAFPLVDSKLWPEQKDAFIYAAKIARTPYRAVRGPEAVGPMLTQESTGVYLSARLDNRDNGLGNIAKAEFYIDVPPWSAGARANAMSAKDGDFNSPDEEVEGYVQTAGLSIDKHIIYVRGRDAMGNWGAVSAVFLDLRANQPTTIDSVSPLSPLTINAWSTQRFEVTASDANGDPLSYAWSLDGTPVGANAKFFDFTPADTDIGDHTLTVTVSDGVVGTSHVWSFNVEDDPDVQVIDNSSAGTSQIGTWSVSSAVDPIGGESLYSNAGSKFRWTPTLPGPDVYEVYAWWTYHPNRSSNVPYRVAHANGVDTVTVDQKNPALDGRWNLLGAYRFDAGGANYVEVSSGNGQASADAVKFVRVDDGSANEAPQADAGPDQTVGEGVLVQLDGTESSDPDGSIAAYRWTQTAGTGVTLSASMSARPTFNAPLLEGAAESLVFDLVVTDDQGAQASDRLTVTVENTGDEELVLDNRDAGATRTGTWKVSGGANPWDGQSLYSDSGSTFRWTPSLPTDGVYEVYAWWTYHANRSTNVPYDIVHGEGIDTVTVNQHMASMGGRWNLLGTYTFTAAGGEYVEVSSDNGQASADAVKFVKVDGNTTNQSPQADAGPGQTVSEGALVQLDGTGSGDADGAVASYRWTQTAGVSVSLSDSTSARPTFSAPSIVASSEDLIFALTVTDDQGAAASDTVTITVVGAGGGEVVVDNRDPRATRTGTWEVSTGASPWAGESLYSDSGSVFRWTPELPASGVYDVYAWWTYHTNRSSNVPYAISHRGGSDTVTVNQRAAALGGRWNLLGTYTFDAAGAEHVEVSSASGQAGADAIRFVRIGDAN